MLTITALGLTMAGVIISTDNKIENDEAGMVLFIGGTVLFNIGVPFWIAGGVKAANNKRAMEMAKSNANLSFGMTKNGVGLTFNF